MAAPVEGENIVKNENEYASKVDEYIEKIHYSDRYSDDYYEYRHVILPKPLLKLVPKDYFDPNDSGVLRLLTEEEWRGIGIMQSLGWQHYEVHAPEPHVLLFRRLKGTANPPAPSVNPAQARQARDARRK